MHCQAFARKIVPHGAALYRGVQFALLHTFRMCALVHVLEHCQVQFRRRGYDAW